MERNQTEMMFSNFSLGRQLRDEGICRVESNNGSFVEYMRKFAYKIAQRNGTVTINDLRQHANQIGMQPKHPNAWGSVLRCSWFRPVGFAQAKLPQSHARCIRTWEIADYG